MIQGTHCLEQFFAERLVPKTRSPPQPLPLFRLLLPSTQLHPLLKLFSSRPAVPDNSHFSQHPVSPQPTKPASSAFQIFQVTAPAVGAQLLLSCWPHRRC